MSREILFKGWCPRNEKWIEGDVIFQNKNTVIRRRSDAMSYQIDPSTVCQYTGLEDRNGVKIWEGDIVEAYDDERLVCTGVVQLNEHLMMWVANNTKDKYKNTPLYAPEKLKSMECTRGYIIKGNMFDNPELLEGGTDEDD